MSACVNKKIQGEGLSMRIDEETMLMQKQGIVTILGSHSKVTSDSSSSSEGEEDEREQICNSIQLDKKEKNEKPGQFDIWSSILTQKANDEASKLSAPYIHPLVKRRSKSCLSEKSLEICTESLGSETGSDGFSSETGDSDKEEDEEELKVPKYNYSLKKKSLKRCFPPPLPSLSCQHGGPSLHMRPHRDNGRLFLQAVSIPSQNNFVAQRQHGRLVLTFAREDEEEEEEEEDDDVEEEEDESVIEKALMMNKPIGLVNKSLKWLEKFNEVSRAWMVPSTEAVFNAYDYYSSLKKNNISSKVVVSGNLNTNQISNDTQQLLVLRGKNGDYLIHNFKSCKDSKRDFLFWEPYCIATKPVLSTLLMPNSQDLLFKYYYLLIYHFLSSPLFLRAVVK